MGQYWLIGYHKCTLLMQDVNNRENTEERRGSTWNSVLSTQFFCQPKSAPKKSIKDKNTEELKHESDMSGGDRYLWEKWAMARI